MPTATRAVTADADGFVVSTGDRYATLREALDAELVTVATTEKPLYFRDADTGDLNGEMRWLPACDVEGAPVRGIRIDAPAIEEMAQSLNSSPRAIPINGGPTPPGLLPSAPHGDVNDSSTLANGRAQWGVVVNSADTTKLYLYAEVMPHIARELDVGRLSEGSVCFVWDSTEATDSGDAPRGVQLISHAFTNDPAVTTLEPTNSVRQGRRPVSFLGACRASHHKGARMAKKQIRAFLLASPKIAALAVARRGPALDKLAEVAKSLGISIDDEMSEEGYNSPTNKAVCALRAAAEVEKILEGGKAGDAATPAAQTRTDDKPAADPAARAEGDPPAPDAGKAESDKAIADVVSAFEKATGKTGAKIEDVIAWIAEQANAKPEGDGNAPPAGMDASARQRDALAFDMLRSKHDALSARVKELEPFEASFKAREHSDFVDAEAKKRGLTLTAKQRTGLIALDRKGVLAAFDLIHSPPQGVVMGDPPEASRTGGAGLTIKSATDAEMEAARAALGPDKSRSTSLVRSHAQKLARAKHPHLFEAGGDSADPIV